jgi:hypothetical protein
MPVTESPDRAAGLRIEAGGELVEEHDVGLVDQRERDEEPLLLAAGERHEPGVALAVESESCQERVRVGDAGVERPPEIHGFPDLDALLELRLLVLHADPLAERAGVAAGIEAEHGNGALVGHAVALHAFHRRRLSRAVRTDQAENLSLEHLERHVVHGHRPAVALAEMGDRDDGVVQWCSAVESARLMAATSSWSTTAVPIPSQAVTIQLSSKETCTRRT